MLTLESAFYTTVTISITVLTFSDTDTINIPTDSKPLTPPTELAPSFSFHISRSSSKTSPLSYRNVKGSQLFNLPLKAPVINIIYKQRKTPESGLKTVSAHTFLYNLLSVTLLKT